MVPLFPKKVNKLNIYHVNGVWKHGRDQYDDDEDEEDPTIPDDHVYGSTPQPSISDHSNIISQIWDNIQELQHERIDGIYERVGHFDKIHGKIDELQHENFMTFTNLLNDKYLTI